MGSNEMHMLSSMVRRLMKQDDKIGKPLIQEDTMLVAIYKPEIPGVGNEKACRLKSYLLEYLKVR